MPKSLRLAGRTALCTCLAALVAPLPAPGQTVRDDVTLSPVLVTGDATGTGPVGAEANPLTQTGAKAATPLTLVPQSVSVIGSEALERDNLRKVDEALRYSAGVFTQPFGPDSDTDWHFIRGFQSTATGVYLDGLPNFSYAFGGSSRIPSRSSGSRCCAARPRCSMAGRTRAGS